MVFAVNSLLYLNQSVPPYGVALNSLTNGTTAFPLRKILQQLCFFWTRLIVFHVRMIFFYFSGLQDEVKITLDCSQADFIGYDKMVISLKGGEM